MSAFESLRQALTGHFQAHFVTPAPTLENPDAVVEFLPVAYDNKAFKQPTTAWGRFAIRQGQRAPMGVSTTEFRTPGFVALQVFLPEDKGTKVGHEAADKMASFLDNASVPVPGVGAVLMRQCSYQVVGSTNAGWFQANIVCNFQFDEVPGTT
jgi:hypothetical protein